MSDFESTEALQAKLERANGLCTSVAKSEVVNANRIWFILNASIDGESLQCACRSSDDWRDVDGLPMDFASLRYRVAQ